MRIAPQEIRTYFVTSVTASRRRIFQVEQRAQLLAVILHKQQAEDRIALHAFVIMPDHIHLLITPSPEISLEKTVQYIKGGFSFSLASKLDVWQRGYDSRRIADVTDFDDRLRYIHQNPIRAKMVDSPESYRFSSAHPSHQSDAMPAHLK